MSRVIDCSLFLNEFELLELRLRTLWDVVDEFIVVETPVTFAGRANPLAPRQEGTNWWFGRRWEPFNDRLIHHVAKLPPPAPEGPFPFGGRWPVEYAMRNAICDALRPIAQPQDYVMISDVDEIPDPACVGHRGTFIHRLFLYKLNALFDQDWLGTVGVAYADLLYLQPQYIRAKQADWPKIRGGWHFSYMGGEKRMREKVMAGGDGKFDQEEYLSQLATRAARLEDPMGRVPPEGLRPGHIVPVDESFPPYVREHPERFPGWIG